VWFRSQPRVVRVVVEGDLTDLKIERITEIFNENGFKGGPDEARRIGLEILDVLHELELDEED
jgi:hypothetical protein